MHTHTHEEEELTLYMVDGTKILVGDATKGSILCQCSQYPSPPPPPRFRHHNRCKGKIIGTEGPSLANHYDSSRLTTTTDYAHGSWKQKVSNQPRSLHDLGRTALQVIQIPISKIKMILASNSGMLQDSTQMFPPLAGLLWPSTPLLPQSCSHMFVFIKQLLS